MPPRGIPYTVWIRRALVGAGALTVALLVTAALWGLLSLVGDGTGVRAVRWLSLAAAACLVIDLAALIVLLAADRLAHENE